MMKHNGNTNLIDKIDIKTAVNRNKTLVQHNTRKFWENCQHYGNTELKFPY